MLFLSIFHLRRQFLDSGRGRAAGGREECVEGHRTGIAAVAQADRDGARLGSFSPTTSMYGTFFSCARRILSPSFSLRSSHSTRRPAGGQFRGDVPALLREAVRDRQDHRLHRREPEGKVPAGVLDQDAHEALERAQDRAVDHDRPVLGAVLADVLEVEALGL